MVTKDGRPDDLIPNFLSEHAEAPEQPSIGKAWDGAVISSRILKTGILIVTATAIDFAILSVGNPVALFANVTASLVDISALQAGTGQSTPTIQSAAGAQALPPTARDAPTGDKIAAAFKTAVQSQTEDGQPPTEALLKQFQAWAADEEMRDEITAAFEPADQSQSEIRQPPAEALLKQFQAWAAEEDARVQGPPVQPIQDAQARELLNARAQVKPVQKHRHVKSAQVARADVRPPRARVRLVQNAHAQDRSVRKNAQAPWPLQRIGWLD